MSDDKNGSKVINQIAENRRETERLIRERSGVYRAQVHLMQEIYGEKGRKNGLSQRERMLVAVGAAVQSGSESSIEWTVTRALNHGASKEMVEDAIDIALLNGGTFVVANARFAFEVLDLRLKKPLATDKRLAEPAVFPT